MTLFLIFILVVLLCLLILAHPTEDDYEKRQYIPLGGKKKAIRLAKECYEEAVQKWQKSKTIHGGEYISLEETEIGIRRQKRMETGIIWGAMHRNADPPSGEDDNFPIAGYE